MTMVESNLTVERIAHSGHYVISAFVVDEWDNEFLHSISFYFYDADEIDLMKEAYMYSLVENRYVLS